MLQNLEETMVNGKRNNLSNYINHKKNNNANDNYGILLNLYPQLYKNQ